LFIAVGARSFSSGGEESVQELVQRVAIDQKWDQKKADAVIATLASADLKTSAALRALRSEDWRDLGLTVGVRRALQDAVKQVPTAGKIPLPIVPVPCMYLCLSGSASMSVRVFPVFILPSLSSVSVSVSLLTLHGLSIDSLLTLHWLSIDSPLALY
jgi:hypothetical protein